MKSLQSQNMLRFSIASLILTGVLVNGTYFRQIGERPKRDLDFPKLFPPQEEVIIEENDTWKVSCENLEPIEWILPFESQLAKARVSITDGELHNSRLTYVSHLELSRSNHRDTGYFSCQSRKSDPVSSKDVSARNASIYLYVKSKGNLFVNREEHLYVHVHENEETVIPCRPTDPSIQVQIIRDEREDITNELSSKSLKFDPRRGLIIQKGQEFHTGGITCIATRGDQSEQKPAFLNFIPKLEKLHPPTLTASTGRVLLGSSFQLNCHITNHQNLLPIELTLNLPRETNADETLDRFQIFVNKTSTVDGILTPRKFEKTLIIKSVRESDVGTYYCFAKQGGLSASTSYNLTEVYAKNKDFIGEPVFHGNNIITIYSTRMVQWVFTLETSPEPKFTWFDPKGHQIDHERLEKYNMIANEKNHEVKLQIDPATLEDTGLYNFVIQVGGKTGEHNDVGLFTEKTIQFELHFVQKPTVVIDVVGSRGEEDELFSYNKTYNITCQTLGYPIDQTTLKWTFQKCETKKKCDPSRSIDKGVVVPSDNNNGSIHYLYNSTIKHLANETGKFSCEVCLKPDYDSKKCGKNTTSFFLSEFSSGFMVEEPITSFTEGDDINLACAGSKYQFQKVLWERRKSDNWFPLDSPTVLSNFSHFSNLSITDLQHADEGEYRCTGIGLLSNISRQSKTIHIKVLSLEAPTLKKGNNMNGTEIILQPSDSYQLNCTLDGRPEPQMRWFKGQGAQALPSDQEITFDNLTNLNKHFTNNNQTLVIKYATSRDSGWYHCQGTNRAGSYSGSININVAQEASLSKSIWIPICALIVLLIGIIACLTWKVKVYNRKFRELDKAELKQFHEGDPSKINGNLNLADQVDLLPYDHRYEFPKDQLHLGKQIGSGAYGRVLKAKAIGIVPWESTTVVAVKTIKPHADIMHFRSLMMELKVLAHLGKHLNILNLLGACTQNLGRRELYLIVEYCRYGSILSYLHSHKTHFINQVDQETLEINFEIGRDLIDTFEKDLVQIRDEEELSVAYHRRRTTSEFSTGGDNGAQIVWNNELETNRDPSNPQQGIRYVQDPAFRGRIARTKSNHSDYNDGLDRQVNTDMTTLTNFSRDSGRQNSRISRRSQSSQRRNTRQNSFFEDGAHLRPLCTKDLLSWAYQVANGMDYLAQRNVLHGDLACRNILLAANNVVKICDFGLAKKMYKDNNYVKTSNVPMPVKWMAVESLTEYVFSIQSDIWSFGIVLWEMFTLGKTPYPGVEGGEHFSNMLSGGYRMERPDFCPQIVYELMVQCWDLVPGNRPPFHLLIQAFSRLLDEAERNHYLQLDQNFQLQMGKAPISNPLTVDNKAYLDLFRAPTFEHQTKPSAELEPNEEDGYLLPNRFVSHSEQKISEDEDNYLLANSVKLRETTD